MKSIVISPHFSDGIGPCDSVTVSRPIASILALPLCRGSVFAALGLGTV